MILAKSRSYYLANRNQILDRNQRWRTNNREVVLTGKKRYYQNHREECIKQASEHVYRNPGYYKELSKKHMARKINFCGREMTLSFVPRTGKCSSCGIIIQPGMRRTHMHHTKGYFIIFPWFGTEEICGRCHRIIHIRGTI